MEELFQDLIRQYGKDNTSKVKDVITVVKAKIIAKNLFGWNSYLEEVLIGLIGYMIQTEFQYSGGAYVACGMQSAIDHCRYCNAAKRKGDYELAELDDFYQVADELEDEQIWQKRKEEALCSDIEIFWGAEMADAVRDFLSGENKDLKKDILKKMKSPEFIAWFKEHEQL